MNRNTLALFALSTGLAFTGCINPGSSPEARFFQLQPNQGASAAERRPDAPAVRVGPIEVAPYLSRPQWVTRVGKNELLYHEMERWAEPLHRNLSWVIAQNLVLLSGNPNVFQMRSMPGSPHAVSVTVQVANLERADDGKVHLVASWELRQHLDDELRTESHTAVLSAEGGANTAGDVAALEALVFEFSQRIADSLEAFSAL